MKNKIDLTDPKTMKVVKLPNNDKDKLQRLFDLFDDLFDAESNEISIYSVETLWKLLKEHLYETHGDLLFEVRAEWNGKHVKN